MSNSFYDISVAAYLQGLSGVATVLDKGRERAAAGALDLNALVRYRMQEDMAPFSFQVISVCHHSLGAIQGMEAGLFEPPPKMSDMSYDKLEAMVADARGQLEALSPDAVNALSDKNMVFRIGGRDLPFTTDSFLRSFSLPNFYFHATTTYSVLRLHAVPLGKRDYLGQR